MKAPHAVLGFDPSWEALAWALAGPDGEVLTAGVRKLSGRADRWRVAAELLHELEPLRARAQRVAVEVPGTHAALHGREVQTVRGVSLLAGAVLAWGAACPLPATELEPTHWRAWWGLGGALKREQLKAAAVKLATAQGWAALLPERGREDVAEAMLIASGAARNWALAP